MTISLQSIFISSLTSEKKTKWLPNKREKTMFESISMNGACRVAVFFAGLLLVNFLDLGKFNSLWVKRSVSSIRILNMRSFEKLFSVFDKVVFHNLGPQKIWRI